MSDILFIKTSSLGDVIHHMPAITEARRHLPNARMSWVVEELFVPLARLHPAVDAVIPVAWRRCMASLQAPPTWVEIARFMRTLRAQRYDQIIDTQGLYRTAFMTRIARGRRYGYDADSIREPAASVLYDVRFPVDRSLHAVARNRTLTGLALGYTPEGAPDYGLDRSALAAGKGTPYAVLLHATARATKEWPEEKWIELGRTLAKRGVELVLPWGSPEEGERSRRLAVQIPASRVPDRAPIDALARLIAGAQFVVGVDTGLMHLAAALGVPLVAIFIGSEPGLTGPMGSGPLAVVGGRGASPAVAEVLGALERIV